MHRIAVEAKDWSDKVGIDVVNGFAAIVKLLRSERLVDEGLIVSAVGFSRPARNAAETYGLRLLEIADLEAMAAEAKAEGRTRPSRPPIPLPPAPHYAHTYGLQENFTGRVAERQMLTQWWTGGGRPVLAVVALGGMGKSALTWAWLQRDVLGQALPGHAAEPPEVCEKCGV
ncbi:MAG: restriction endonuclease, partial [Caldilineaceae bacterium]